MGEAHPAMIGGDLKVDFKLTHRQKGLIQAVYLVASSYTFFFRGDTGLSITIGAVISVAAMMQLTAKVDWNDVFALPEGHKH